MTAADRPAVPHPDRTHPGLDTLADLDADALDPIATERVAAHVAGCPRCAEVLATLGVVRADLRALPAPPVPAAVAARLDATLAYLGRGSSGSGRPSREAPVPAEAAASPVPPTSPGPAALDSAATTSAGAGRPPMPRPVADRPPAHRPLADLGTARERKRRRALKVSAGAVAAAFALVAAGASVTALVRNVGDGAGGAATAIGAAQEQDASTGGSSPPASRQPGGQSAPSAAAEEGIPSYSRDTLAAALATIERESAVARISELGETGPAGAMADPARRRACEQSIIGRQGQLRAVRKVTYDGKPAYVFLFADSAGRRMVYVVADECGTGGLQAQIVDRVP